MSTVTRVVGCYLEYDGRFVVLLRHAHKPDGNSWGLPGGKVEPGESDEQAIARELAEETGYSTKPGELELLGVYHFTMPDGGPVDYVTYRVRIDKPHQVVIEASAHAAHKWVTAAECYAMPDAIRGLDSLLVQTGYVAGPANSTDKQGGGNAQGAQK